MLYEVITLAVVQPLQQLPDGRRLIASRFKFCAELEAFTHLGILHRALIGYYATLAARSWNRRQ